MSSRADASRWALRVAGAGLLGATAGIHLDLWQQGYRSISVIGPLFLLNGVAGSLLSLATLASPRALLRAVAVAGAALEVGTLLGLVLAEHHGLFGFQESTRATLFWQSVAVEISGTLVLIGLALLRSPRRRESGEPVKRTRWASVTGR